MQYDVFISYSRKDASEVNSLIERLRREIPGIKIWFDIEGVESADAFKRKIISAIENSNIIIFACSDNSLASEYCEKEVTYAKNLGKKVLPYLLLGSQLKGWLLFDYGNINCIHSSKEDEVARMINDLRRWTQNVGGNNANSSNNTNNTSGDAARHTSNNPANQGSSNNLASQLIFDPVTGEFKQNTIINSHEYVDLGLPSGTKWATCNLGASKAEDYGDYFAWGEISTKPSYDQSNCPTFNKDMRWLYDHGYISHNGRLTLSHDAARQGWGGTWRMPTNKDIEELLKYTTFKWTVLNGILGCQLKSNRNGKSIFLPACGWKKGDSVRGAAIFGYYWGSDVATASTADANGFYYTMSGFNCKAFDRSCGRSIRPVSD